MRLSPSRFSSLFLLASLAVLSGCESRGDGVTTEGTVTYAGQPLADAAITFFPQQGRPLTVPLDPQGAYAVVLPPGDYQVTINVGAPLPEGFQEGDVLPPPTVTLPDRFTVRARTELNATVAEDQSEPINFDLK